MFTPFAVILAVESGGAGHGDYLWAKILFPYTMLSTIFTQSILTPFLLLGIFQYLIYGLLVGLAEQNRKVRAFLFVLLTHLGSVGLCLFFVSKNFS